ncbi:hypothetical protein FB550_102439 [Neobacillus bataviensis]|uniref:Uncharacterized protein n=1 Tax=Neobacillus bataviensis TaxID=220685 RepID=A0A561DSU2_9BACI|nr:hypothetical protein FB550_102439 [Neobacillus bataviensis]
MMSDKVGGYRDPGGGGSGPKPGGDKLSSIEPKPGV